MTLRVLVTGGCGMLGRHVCRELITAGMMLQALSRTSPIEPANHRYSRCFCDITDAPALREAVRTFAPDAVIHLAALIASPQDGREDWRVFQVNAQGTANLMEACAALAVPPAVVYTSTMSVYDYEHPEYVPVDEMHPVVPASAYGLSKYMGEMICRHYAQWHTTGLAILRLPGIYGPGRKSGLMYKLLASAAEEKAMNVPALDSRRDFIYVKDAARAVRLALEAARKKRVVLCNLSGEVPEMAEVLAAVEAIAGRSLVTHPSPGSSTHDFYFSSETARAELGFEPHNFELTLRDFWNEQQIGVSTMRTCNG